MLHDAYDFCRKLYAHTLSLEKVWPTRVTDGTPFPPFLDAEFLWTQLETVRESIGLPSRPVKEGEVPVTELAGENEEDPFLKHLEEEDRRTSGVTSTSTSTSGTEPITTTSSHFDALSSLLDPSTPLRPSFTSTLVPPFASTGYPFGTSSNIGMAVKGYPDGGGRPMLISWTGEVHELLRRLGCWWP